VSDDPSPSEIATTPEWRKEMAAARRLEKFTQGELGVKVGIPADSAQAMISQIETGAVSGSKFVLPICRVLGIPPPMHFITPAQRKWSTLGHRLEKASKVQFEQVLGLIESMLAGTEAPPETEKPTPKVRPIGRASVTTREVPLRPADTLPFEESATSKRKKKPR
jgi:transcriptional regulator with XRE-family HTH domain